MSDNIITVDETTNAVVVNGTPTISAGGVVRIISAGMQGAQGAGSNWGGIGGTLSNQTDLQNALDAKQATLVSGTNIKTVNGATLLGSGDITVGGAVDSVFGRTGVVTAQSGDYTSAQVTENTNLYFTNARAIGATISGYVSGAGTVAATDTVLQAIQKLNGNAENQSSALALKANISGQVFTGAISATNLSGTNTGDQTDVTGNAGTVTTINGRISAGTNVTLGGAGTAADPYVINSSGGGGSGDVVGPASATDNAVARYDGTTGKLIQDSAVTIADTGAVAITSASAAAFAVGPNGATNPAFSINSSAASSATGVSVTSGAAAAGVTLGVTSSVADEILVITSKGSAELQLNAGSVGANALRLRTGGTNRVIVSGTSITYTNTNQHLFSTSSLSTAASVRFSFVQPSDTNLTAGTEAPSVYFNLTASRTHASNTAITLQREFRIAGSTHVFAAAGGTITDLGALAIVHGTGGTNATIANNSALLVESNAVANTTNGYGINVSAPTGATNNYAARLIGALDFGAGAGTAGQVLTSGGAGASPTWSSAGGGGGITRSVNTINTNTTAGSTALTDYIYICTGTIDVTLPTASGNSNQYVIKNNGTGVITIIGTVDGVINPTITAPNSLTLISNGTDWSII